MKQRRHKHSAERVWSIQTNDTYMLHARVPLDLVERLRSFVGKTKMTNTDVMLEALDEYLEKRDA